MAEPSDKCIEPGDHESYLRLALSLATQSTPRPTNYRVGAVLVNTTCNKILSTGYTLELPGNTHAEQCCLDKLAAKHSHDAERGDSSPKFPDGSFVLYTTMEPCSMRLSGNLPCADRIVAANGGNFKVETVYVGVSEPDTFVAQNSGRRKLEDAGIGFIHVPGLEKEILEVATAGHKQ